MRRRTQIVWFCAASVCLTRHALGEDVVWIGRFDRMPESGIEAPLPAPWQVIRLDDKVRPTRYRVRIWDGVHAIESIANNSMALLARPVQIDLDKTPILCWRWRIDGVVQSADIRRRNGDDYAARVYVAFALPPESMRFLTKLSLKAARRAFGDAVPDAAINYVWDNSHPEGMAVPNAYTDRTIMIVARSGDALRDQWVWEAHDVARDFATQFGVTTPRVTSVAVASDTDNTGARAHAGFADLHFASRGAQCGSEQ